MKKWMVLAALALSGCAQINSYDEAVKTPAPLELQGNWQTVGPQSKLISSEAMASLIVSADGATLDCRQWQRVIAVPGKLMRDGDKLYNVTEQRDVYRLERQDGELEFDGLTLKRVDKPTVECGQALKSAGLKMTR